MKLLVLNCVGLTPRHLGADTPNLSALAAEGFATPLIPDLPAVTTTAQASMATGVSPQEHGIVGNGWYFRDLGEILFWRQSEALIQAPPAWAGARVLKHFWWYAMNTSAVATVTPRPVYHHDGRKSEDIYAAPAHLKDALSARHGTFPLFRFWGPMAGIPSTRWIAESLATALDTVAVDLALCYLPHLDYDLQRFGPGGPHLAPNLRDLDAAAGIAIAAARRHGARILVVSEYGLSPVNAAVEPNRALRRAGLLTVATNAAGEVLDPGTSRAFAVCDHQLAHIHVRDANDLPAVRRLIEALPGVERTWVGRERQDISLDHPRSGEVVALAADGWWFAHDYWLDPALAPDFAQAVEIHKKPGYDPRELFFDPRGGRRRAATALLRKKLGLRYLLNPCPLDTSLVRGSHGRPPADPLDGPLAIASDPRWRQLDLHHHRDVARLIRHVLG